MLEHLVPRLSTALVNGRLSRFKVAFAETTPFRPKPTAHGCIARSFCTTPPAFCLHLLCTHTLFAACLSMHCLGVYYRHTTSLVKARHACRACCGNTGWYRARTLATDGIVIFVETDARVYA